MDEFPAEPFAAAAPTALPRTVAGDAMADAIDLSELFDVDMDHLAGMLALVAAHWLGGLECLEPVQSEPLESAADGSWRDPDGERDLLAGPALAPKGFHLSDDDFGCGPMETMRARAAVVQAARTFEAITGHPFADGPRADADG